MARYSLRRVAYRLDIVAIGIPDEGAVVGGVVLRPQTGFVQHLGAGGHRGVLEGTYRRPVGGREGDVALAEALAGRAGTDPEVRSGWDPVSDDLAEVHDPLAAQGGQHGLVERGAGGYVSALHRKVIEHGPSLHRPRPPVNRCRWRPGVRR